MVPPRLAIAAVAAAAHGGNRVGHESHFASALHGVGDVALVLGAGTRHAAGLDLAAVGHVFAQHLQCLCSRRTQHRPCRTGSTCDEAAWCNQTCFLQPLFDID